ncbi:MAG: flagellar hook-associated protein FlgL [Lachnospiraceae bacterium]|nr:flagellar hook-associated protein FlgL [Lachnospiraceae bacterium]
MRITNNMIMTKADSNINGVKIILDKTNTQMTTQKKIDKPSDDPVVAVRSLRFSTTLTKVNQYYKKNIPDAESFLEVTETSVNDMRDIVRNVHTLSNQGANDTLTQDDRKTILKQLQALQSQLYDAGNADFAGRTVFTGYRTNKTLTFMNDEKDTSYNIEQKIEMKGMEEYRYYSGSVKVPGDATEILDTTSIVNKPYTEHPYYRVRAAYDNISVANNGDVVQIPYKNNGSDTTENLNVTVYETESDWENATGMNIGDDDAVLIESTGDIIMGKNLASTMKANRAVLDFSYSKTGFKDGELRPEYYYNCVKTADKGAAVNVQYDKFDENGNSIEYDINYTISANQELRVNIEADKIFDSSFIQDINDMIEAVSTAINAYDKVQNLKEMKGQDQYSASDYQTSLDKWMDAANKELDYANNNLQKIFNSELEKSKNYEDTLNLAMTDIGCRKQQLDMTRKQMSDQLETVQDLQSKNDDMDLSEVVLKYTAARTAYSSSLTAAGKLGDMTLLNYI